MSPGENATIQEKRDRPLGRQMPTDFPQKLFEERVETPICEESGAISSRMGTVTGLWGAAKRFLVTSLMGRKECCP